MSFKRRSAQHNGLAVPFVESIFASYGFISYTIGTEMDDEELHELLRKQRDPTSIMLRFRPDRVSVRPGIRSVLCEIKSESGLHPNFSIEIDSYEAAILWNRVCKNVMFVFVDLSRKAALATWADDLPKPVQIYVPRRQGWEDRIRQLRHDYPAADIREIQWIRGSGTPFTTVRKDHPCLIELSRFIESELLEPPQTSLHIGSREEQAHHPIPLFTEETDHFS